METGRILDDLLAQKAQVHKIGLQLLCLRIEKISMFESAKARKQETQVFWMKMREPSQDKMIYMPLVSSPNLHHTCYSKLGRF